MKNLDNIFGIIRKYSSGTGMANERCFAALEKQVVSNSIFFPLFYYLRILQSLELIEISKSRKQIVLTEKGKHSGSINIFNLWTLAVVLLHAMRRVIIVTFLYTLFWPVFLTIQQQQYTEANNEGRLSQK